MKSFIQKSKILPCPKRSFIVLQILIIFLSSAVFCQSNFQKFLDKVNSADSISEKQAVIDSFMTFARSVGIPYLEDTTVNFIYNFKPLLKTLRNNNKSFMSGHIILLNLYNGTIKGGMRNLDETDFYYTTMKFESDARVDYYFTVDGNRILDPENPDKIIANSLGDIDSELRMPDYIYPTEIDYNPDIPHGTREKKVLHSDLIQRDFDIELYLPPSYYSNADKKYPVAYMHDGQNWFKDVIGTVNVLDNLTYQNKIEEFILVGIYSYPDIRGDIYQGSLSDKYESFVINKVLPYIESNYRTIGAPKSRCTGGASDGGAIAAQIACNNPNLFGLCMLLSPALHVGPITDSMTYGTKKDIKFYLDWGTYDQCKWYGTAFRDILLSKNYELEWHEWHDGHTYGNFRAHQDNAFTFLFPSKSAVGIIETENKKITEYVLFQNYPNPFNPTTKIGFRISDFGFVSLKIYDVLGKDVATLVNEEKPAGSYEVTWNAMNLPGGVYFYQLKSSSYTATKKLLLLK